MGTGRVSEGQARKRLLNAEFGMRNAELEWRKRQIRNSEVRILITMVEGYG